ncbi:MAG TPA: 5'/3'-nucleotidase SurE [Candidatus Krumholzibacteria bacterium]|nr:5'/3'-nucleotidase SurE [Candidatus Krumholzibacteria bacterium]HPD72386.1 5'/3'-nucleotidase SurE [Candidatus Krumholzibacteria bacterium]HRY40682.1 5'/3'-nucleotidase SurE [Candidatus Krumholzibacteria bacterium]
MTLRPLAYTSILALSLLASILSSAPRCALALPPASQAEDWPRTVLLTNDDGIDDPGLLALARAFAPVAETIVVAPLGDRSGSTHYVSVYSKHVLQVQERDLGAGIEAYAVDGYPGDCVLLALQGLLADNPPDLVVAGINGGPNLGFDWLASGTIGAARLATVWGVPAIAVSGLAADSPDAAAAVAEWVVGLARSELARGLRAGQYLTVSLPRTDPTEFKGVRVAERAGILLDFRFSQVDADTSGTRTALWAIQRPQPIAPDAGANDATLYQDGYVVIVPMLADEVDREALAHLLEQPESLPEWPETERGE